MDSRLHSVNLPGLLGSSCTGVLAMAATTDLLNLIASLATGLTEAKASLATAQQHLENGWKQTHELTVQLNQLKAELAKLTSSQQQSGPTNG